MRTKYAFIGIILLGLLNLAWLGMEIRHRRAARERDAHSKEQIFRLNRDYLQIRQAWMTSLATQDQALTARFTLIKHHGIRRNLNQIIGQNEKLIIVLSNRQCDTCIDQVLFEIKRHLDKIGAENLLILFNRGDSPAKLWESKKYILPGVDFYELNEPGPEFPLDRLNVPYLFVAGPDGKAHMVFATREDCTEIYLNIISQRFSSTNL